MISNTQKTQINFSIFNNEIKEKNYNNKRKKILKKLVYAHLKTYTIIDNKIECVENLDKSILIVMELDRINTITSLYKILNRKRKSKVKEYETLRNQINRNLYNKYQYDAFLKLKNEIILIQETGKFRNGILVEIDKKYEKYIGTQLLDNERLQYFLDNPKHGLEYKLFKIEDFEKCRYGDFSFEYKLKKYRYPLSIYLLNHSYNSTENSFMECFMYLYKKNRNSILYKPYDVFEEISRLLNPDYPLISPRAIHPSVTLLKDDLIDVEKLLSKTSSDFRLAIDDLLAYFDINKDEFINFIK